MQEMQNYNFRAEDIADKNYAELFATRRRDSLFSYVFKEDGEYIAIRDHLGAVPLFYRFTPSGVSFSTTITDLIQQGDTLNKYGLKMYVATGTVKLAQLCNEIFLVPPGCAFSINETTRETRVVYQYTIPILPPFKESRTTLLNQLDSLLAQAIRRTAQFESSALYLSGGIDSALIGIYLKKQGVRVHAYTSLPWGEGGTELTYAKINASVIKTDSHTIIPLETSRYKQYLDSALDVYKVPHGNSTLIGVTSLWNETSLDTEKQVYLGQNTDTATCSVPAQYVSFFVSKLPRVVQKRMRSIFGKKDALSNYLSIITQGAFDSFPWLTSTYPTVPTSSISILTLAGMYFGHSPVDGECLSLPGVQRGMVVSNPYYDMDIIEFCLRLPSSLRLGFSRKSKTGFTIEKRIFQLLALRYLPREVVYRKKGFTVPWTRDERAKECMEHLPTSFAHITANTPEQRVALATLMPLVKKYSLVVEG